MLPYPLVNARRLHGGPHALPGPAGICSAAAQRQYDAYVRSGLTLALLQLRDNDDGLTPDETGSGKAESAS